MKLTDISIVTQGKEIVKSRTLDLDVIADKVREGAYYKLREKAKEKEKEFEYYVFLRRAAVEMSHRIVDKPNAWNLYEWMRICVNRNPDEAYSNLGTYYQRNQLVFAQYLNNVAAEFGVGISTIYRQVGKLIRAGLIENADPPTQHVRRGILHTVNVYLLGKWYWKTIPEAEERIEVYFADLF